MLRAANTPAMTLRGAVVDLDGTVYEGGKLLPGARAGIDSLRDAGIDPLFFSNNPTRDGAAYVEYLADLGLDVRPGEACSAGVVTTEYLREHHANDEILLVGSGGLRDQFRAAGLSLASTPADADVLVGSWTREFGYDDMSDALAAVGPETAFVGSDPDRTVPSDDGGVVPGSGAIIDALAAVVGRDPDAILGKPSERALAVALDRLGCAPEECLVVGDRLDTDLAMGARAGMTTALVLSGIADRDDLADSEVTPDYVIEGLGDIEEVLADP